jgi:hypothetical protein
VSGPEYEEDLHAIFIQQFTPAAHVQEAIDRLGMWLLDLIEAEGLKPINGVKVEFVERVFPAAPEGWVPMRLLVYLEDPDLIDVEA